MPVQDDEVMLEIRRYRAEFAARFGNDLALMAKYLQQRERESGQPVVVRPPRRVTADQAEAPSRSS